MGVFDSVGDAMESAWSGAGDFLAGADGGAPVAPADAVASNPPPVGAAPVPAHLAMELFGNYTDPTPAAPGALDGLGGIAKDAAAGVGGAAESLYDGYQKQTDFKQPLGLLDKGIDWVERTSDEGGRQMVESAKGIPVVEELAEGAAFMNHVVTQVGGGVAKGAGDLVGGLANAFFHPIDAASGIEGVIEHSGLPGVGSTLKSVHGLYDLAVHGGGEYGDSVGDLANHVLNPLQSSEDDQKANMNMVTGILAPGELDRKPGEKGVGWDVWRDKPLEAAARAVTNIAPIALGLGEAAAGEEATQAGRLKPATSGPESIPPTKPSPYLPDGVVPPKPFNPDIPVYEPSQLPTPKPALPAPEVVPEQGPQTLRSPGVDTPGPETLPGLGPVKPTEVPPEPRAPQPTQPGLGPVEPEAAPEVRSRRSRRLTGSRASEAGADSFEIPPDHPFNQPPKSVPPPSVDSLLEGLRRQPVQDPVRPPPGSEPPSVDELLPGL
jgi:hypothetical protein